MSEPDRYIAPPSVLATATRLAREARQAEEARLRVAELEAHVAINLVQDLIAEYGPERIHRMVTLIAAGMGKDVCRCR